MSNDLPALTGVEYADINADQARTTALARLDATIRATAGDVPADVTDQLAAIYREVALRQTDAQWWHDRAGDSREHGVAMAVARKFTQADKARVAAIKP